MIGPNDWFLEKPALECIIFTKKENSEGWAEEKDYEPLSCADFEITKTSMRCPQGRCIYEYMHLALSRQVWAGDINLRVIII